MANYAPGGIQYDSSVTYNTEEHLYVFSGQGEGYDQPSYSQTVYQASNNGQWYAGDTYTVFYDHYGTEQGYRIIDNSGSQWFYDYTTVLHSFSGPTGGSSTEYETTLHARNGDTYITDTDTSGNTVGQIIYNAKEQVISNNNMSTHTISAQGNNRPQSMLPDILSVAPNVTLNPAIAHNAETSVTNSHVNLSHLVPTNVGNDFMTLAYANAPMESLAATIQQSGNNSLDETSSNHASVALENSFAHHDHVLLINHQF